MSEEQATQVCPQCSAIGETAALQPKDGQLECPNCLGKYPVGAGHKLTKQEFFAMLDGQGEEGAQT